MSTPAARLMVAAPWRRPCRPTGGSGLVGVVQAAGFAAAEAAAGDEVVEGVEPVFAGDEVVEEGAGLFGGPRHDPVGELVGVVPFGDAFVGPDQLLRCWGGGQFDEGGLVDADPDDLPFDRPVVGGAGSGACSAWRW